MESVAVFGGARPFLSSSSTRPSLSHQQPNTPSLCLSCAPACSILRTPCHHHSHTHNNLSAFPSSARLFFNVSSTRSISKPRIFLPRLVAALENVEESYIMVKPDGVQRGLVGEIISRFEKKGFKLTGLKLFQCPKDLAEEHYKDLKGKPFFPGLIEYITSGPVVCMAWEGVGVVASARKLIGATNPLQAEPGTIRGDLAVQTGRNVIHGSDSPENGKREIGLWFKEGELCEWTPTLAPWLRE